MRSRREILAAGAGVCLAGLAGCSSLRTHRRWTTGSGRTSSVVVADGLAYAVADNTVHAIDPTDGSYRWSEAPSHESITHPPVIRDGIAYVTVFGSGVHAVEDDTEHWSFPTGVSTGLAATADRVLAGSSATLHGLDRTDGTEDWSVDFGTDLQSLAPTDDGVVFAATEEEIVALDSTDGTELWRRVLLPGRSGGQLTVDGDTLYATVRDGVRTFARATGDGGWRADFPPYGTPTVAEHDGDDGDDSGDGPLVFVGGTDGTVRALRSNDGEIVVEHTVDVDGEDEIPTVGSPALLGKQVVVPFHRPPGDVGEADGEFGGLYAVDAVSGDRRWSTSLDGPSMDSPTVHEGRVIVGDDRGVHALSPDARFSL